jgi:hypothetical protein
VTNLGDGGAGSFRDAVSQSGRTVVFDVGGYITLASEVGVQGDITIAGQTAPGGGIGIRGGEVSFGGKDNIICRFVRIRPGAGSATTANGINMYRAENIILDHVSVAFAKWNNLSGVSDDWQNHPVDNITVQHSIISNPIGQQFGAHAESVAGRWFWYGNLFANSHNRNPLAKFDTVFINNVNYNYQGGYTTHTSTSFKHDVVNNYFIGGPGSGGSDNTWYQVDKNQSIYYAGNMKDRNLDGVLNGGVTTPYWYQGEGTVLTEPWSPVTGATPVYDAVTAYARVMSLAGALPRDEVDTLLVSQVQSLGDGPTGTGAGTAGPGGGLYSSPSQTGLADGGFGILPGGTAEADVDRDGMADDFERDTGSDPQTPNHTESVPAGAFVPDLPAGYTRLDEYLHFLASPHLVVPMNGAADVDLREHAAGYAVPRTTYRIADSHNVDVTFRPDRHSVQVAASSNYVGRGHFDFWVGDGSGAGPMTQKVLVVVSGARVVPAAPTGLTATAVSSSVIALQWHDLSPNEDGFLIERSAEGTVFAEIGSVGVDVTTFNDDAGPSASFVYRVRAHNMAGRSGYSNGDGAATEPGPPGAPRGITASPGNARVSLRWLPVAGASNYRVARSVTPGGPYVTLAVLAGHAFDDPYAVNGTTYYYVATAGNAHGQGPDSAEVMAVPAPTRVYPAEDEPYGNGAVFEDKNAGFTGTGYVNFSPDAGSFLQFDQVDGGAGGTAALRFRFALGNVARTGRIIVNGSPSPVTFDGTGSWTTWSTHTVTATLAADSNNTIRLESTGADLANIDEMSVSTSTPPPAAPAVTEAGREGGNLIMAGYAGAPPSTCLVLTSTDLHRPQDLWTPVTTNQLDGNGAFHITNTLDPSALQRYYRVDAPQVPYDSGR